MFSKVEITVKEYRELIETKVKYDILARTLTNEFSEVLEKTFKLLGNIDWQKIVELKDEEEKLDEK